MQWFMNYVLIPLFAFVGGYLTKDFVDKFLPSSNWIILAIKNILSGELPHTENSFRTVLCVGWKMTRMETTQKL